MNDLAEGVKSLTDGLCQRQVGIAPRQMYCHLDERKVVTANRKTMKKHLARTAVVDILTAVITDKGFSSAGRSGRFGRLTCRLRALRPDQSSIWTSWRSFSAPQQPSAFEHMRSTLMQDREASGYCLQPCP